MIFKKPKLSECAWLASSVDSWYYSSSLYQIATKLIWTVLFPLSEHFQSLPEDDEVRKSVDHTLESLQQDDDRDVRFFSGGKVKEYNFSVSDNESDGSTMLDSFEGMLQRPGGGMMTEEGYLQKITRGINEYTISNTEEDDEDDDSDLVEEVYMEEHGLGDDDVIQMQPGDVIIEEYYTEEGGPVSGSVASSLTPAGATTQYVVEEIVEEVIATIGQPKPKNNNPDVETGDTESGKSSEESSPETDDANSTQWLEDEVCR